MKISKLIQAIAIGLGIFLSLNTSVLAKTIRVDKISDLQSVKYSSGDTIEVNSEIEFGLESSKRENAQALVAFLSDKVSSRFVLDRTSGTYYYHFIVTTESSHLDHLERLGPKVVRTKISSLLKFHSQGRI